MEEEEGIEVDTNITEIQCRSCLTIGANHYVHLFDAGILDLYVKYTQLTVSICHLTDDT